MRECFVSVRHAVRVFLLLHRIAAVVRRVENLSRQTIGHRLFTTAAGIGDDPTNRQGAASFLMYLDRHLIRRTADASRLHFNRGLHVIDLPHRIVENALGHTLFAFPHDAADELRHERAAVDRIGKYFASFGYSSSWHIFFSLLSAGFGPFRSILRASLFAIGNTDRVERAANHVIADAGEVLHAAASDQDDRVLLQVVTDAGNISRDLDAVGQAHASDLAER